jgi:AcrR family transcriptional regulator
MPPTRGPGIAMNQAQTREHRRRRSEIAVERAALDLFLQKGFNSTTVDEIADEVDISRRTFFRYFESKEGVVFSNVNHDMNALETILASRSPDEPPLVALRESLIEFADYLEDRRDIMRARFELVSKNPELQARGAQIREEWTGLVERALGRHTGLAEPDVRTRLLAAVGVTALRIAVQDWIESGATLASLTRENFRILEDSWSAELRL